MLFALGVVVAQAEPGYIRADNCAGCHREIWETYRQTGMGRSFYRPSDANIVEDYTRRNTYYHQASDSYFTMVRRDGKFYQRRYQLDPAGKPINIMEKQIDYILGSGNHVRAYISRTAQNTMIELPLAWYAENGGYWAMNPGYDRPHNDGFRRTITYDCMFCHNAYPEIPQANVRPFSDPVYSGELPEGIDCQRCHGPGARHVQLADSGASEDAIRKSIVNPARLSEERQMEICMECHLETTSFPLPNAVQRYERGPFSYRPGEPLQDFLLSFDHAPGTGHDDKFEIVSAVYRLRKSACFLRSNGRLNCTTCHNPHNIPRGEEAARQYNAVCRQCHATLAKDHTRDNGCIGCHMPKRRTEDVVHVAVTDHLIQRRPPAGDLLAERAERHDTEATAYHGPVVPYYPATFPSSASNDLYLAVAQVIDRSNLDKGIEQLTVAIDRYRPPRAEFYFDLAEAWRNKGDRGKAIPFYRQAVERDPKFVYGLQKLGTALRRTGQFAESAEVLRRATGAGPGNAPSWYELGLTWQALGKKTDAVSALQKAAQLDPDMAEARNNLGVVWSAAGDLARAEPAFREAIRIQPDYADAHGNLANLLASRGDLDQAKYHFQISLKIRPDDAMTHYNYAMALGRTRQFDHAQHELEESLHIDPKLADAHLLLADLLMAKGQTQAALPHYQDVVQQHPESGRAQLGLGMALAMTGDAKSALPHLEKAAADPDPAIRNDATQALHQLGK